MVPAWRFLVDEDLPRSTAGVLRRAGYEAEDVRDVGLLGADDHRVFAYAQTHHAAIITTDTDFANVLRFAPGTASGIIVMRVPSELLTSSVNAELLRALREIAHEDLRGLLVIVEVGRVRPRRIRQVP